MFSLYYSNAITEMELEQYHEKLRDTRQKDANENVMSQTNHEYIEIHYYNGLL